MSTENLLKFAAAIERNPEWKARVLAITGTQEERAWQWAAISEEVGFPVPAEKFLWAASADSARELSIEELSEVAGGGRGYPEEYYVWNQALGKKVRRVSETE